ncbi:polysaccharide deacetylase family protein [Gramella sp. KN1008]|uniref:polysaccharide deacetylase family protein n=1 Tax=Gramella sp. KN1008 TaxID=2529298 RepID=UPI001040C30E|nr:polysaccharide deacetylase family protein [Gramella sp. KN1008]TBW26539.1 polysaccharide deacetylase [Gramella sp. KN1008]
MKALPVILIIMMLNVAHGQKKVAITIDDVPNIQNQSIIATMDSLEVPVAIFINEKYVDNSQEGQQTLEEWISKNWVTPGNHSYSHARYSEVGLDSFQTEITQGEIYSRKLASKYNKDLKYFRFPFNDLGKDSLLHIEILKYLNKKNYVNTPFTVESSDWIFNSLYEYYLKEGKADKADSIGEKYVTTTIAYFKHFSDLSKEVYGKEISHISLCHDNLINAEYLPQIVTILRGEGYEFLSLKEALKDSLYKQRDSYFQKWGISWLYRWMENSEVRKDYFKKEPSMEDILSLFKDLK